MTRLTRLIRWLQPFALLAAACLAAPAQADVDLRIQSRPIASDIQAYVRVTDATGPVSGLVGDDFAVTLDGVALSTATFSLPPAQDDTQRVSVIFAMDYSGSVINVALDDMRDAVIGFIEQMRPGDYAAILKFTTTNPDGASIVQAFTAIDDGGVGDMALVSAIMAPYGGDGTNLLDAVKVGIETFLDPGTALPIGPKAIILISDGQDNDSIISQSDVVAYANDNGLSVFAIGVGNIATDPAGNELLESLAENTGGDYFPVPDSQDIAAAYVTVAESLNNEYKLTIPTIEVQDCDQHALEITVQGETASVSFTRCDVTPDDFNFTNETGVARSSVITSDIVTIVGIDTATSISVTGGEYSIDCDASFTSAPGTIAFEDEVCVRHTASASFSTDTTTVLIVGGVDASFSSTTQAAPPPPANGGGGGGATGVLELLLGLGALFGARRRWA